MTLKPIHGFFGGGKKAKALIVRPDERKDGGRAASFRPARRFT